MASFCGGCGFPQGANVAFCPNCGARQPGAGGPAPAAPAPMQPVTAAPARPQSQMAGAAAAKSGSGLKIVLVLVGVLAFAGIAAIGGLIYVGHRVKVAVTEKAKEYGVDLPSASAAVSSSSAQTQVPKNTCDILSKDEVTGLIGQPIVRSEMRDGGCWYFGPPGLSTKLANEQASNVAQTLQSPDLTEGKARSAMDQIANSVGAGEQMNNNGEEMPLLLLVVDPDGKGQMLAMKMAKGIFGGIAKGAGAGAPGIGSDVPGLGDEAMRLPKLGLNVLKGNTVIRVMPGPIPNGEAKSIDVARAVLKKI